MLNAGLGLSTLSLKEAKPRPTICWRDALKKFNASWINIHKETPNPLLHYQWLCEACLSETSSSQSFRDLQNSTSEFRILINQISWYHWKPAESRTKRAWGPHGALKTAVKNHCCRKGSRTLFEQKLASCTLLRHSVADDVVLAPGWLERRVLMKKRWEECYNVVTGSRSLSYYSMSNFQPME